MSRLDATTLRTNGQDTEPPCRRNGRSALAEPGRKAKEKPPLWKMVLKPFSLFFRPGLYNMAVRRREYCPAFAPGSNAKCVRVSRHASRTLWFSGRQVFTLERTKPPPLVCTKHETRDTEFMLFTKHESRDTNHDFYGRSVRRGRARIAPTKTAARIAAPAARPRLPCPPFPGKKYCPAPVSVPRQPFPVGLTTSAVRRGQRDMKPCRERGTFHVAATDAEPSVIIDLDKAPLSIGTRP